MKKQAFNPYLPSYEYIPDGEPYVFGDRVYVYGSHDQFNGIIFCWKDYVCWSAPIDDLSDWRYEGVIYKKKQDPNNKWGIRCLFAPDVTQGVDNKFYLYYALDFMGVMGVAVCDTPAGEYKFLGHVHFPDGRIWGRTKGDQFPFDPGIFVDDDKKVYLYSGFYTPVPSIATGLKKLKFDGGVVMELEPDMMTIKKEPKVIFPKDGNGSFLNHEFFEASSMRKIGDTYYFVYSSRHNHELCYAVSKSPTGGFTFGGTLVSIGDLFLDGNVDEAKARNYLGNTHGGMVHIKGQWYIFYHRQTNRHSYSRQGCAQPLEMDENGHFKQAEITSCGLNAGPLRGEGRYQAYIACNLWSKNGVGRYDCRFSKKRYASHPYFTQKGKDRQCNPNQYIANMRDGAVAGFKYFQMDGADEIIVEIRGKAEGEILVAEDEQFMKVCARIVVMADTDKIINVKASLEKMQGAKPLFFQYRGAGIIDFIAFTLGKTGGINNGKER